MRIGLIRTRLSPRAKWHAEHWERGRSLCGRVPSHTWDPDYRKRADEVEQRLGFEREVTCGLCREQLTYRTPTWADAWTRLGEVPELCRRS